MADCAQVEESLLQVQEQVRELATSIQVKEQLLEELITTDHRMKAANSQMVKKIQLLYEESAATRRDLREAQRSLKLAETDHPQKGPKGLFKERVADCRKTLLELQRKIDVNEESLKLVTSVSNDRDLASAKANMEQMKADQAILVDRLQQEQARKRQLEAEVESDRLRILSLEARVQSQEEQVRLSLQLSQDLEEQRAFLASEEQRLKEAQMETQMLKEHLEKEQQSVATLNRSLTDNETSVLPSYLPFDEKRIRSEIEELRQYKEDDLRSERQFLEHRKEHFQQFESQCQHCQMAALAAGGGATSEQPRGFSDEDEWMLNELDVMAEVIDVAIDYKNQQLTGKTFLYDETFAGGHFLLKKLCSLSAGESRHILHKYLERIIDLRTEGKKRDIELEGLSDQLKEYYRIIQHQNHCINVKSMEYERKLDIQKREYLQKLSLLAKSQDGAASNRGDHKSHSSTDLVEAYERKIRHLKEDLKRTREHSQLYKRFYRENKHRFEASSPPQQQPDHRNGFTEPPIQPESKRKSSGGSDGSQASALDAARVEKFQRHAQKMMRDQSGKKDGGNGSKVVIRDKKKLQIIVGNENGESSSSSPLKPQQNQLAIRSKKLL